MDSAAVISSDSTAEEAVLEEEVMEEDHEGHDHQISLKRNKSPLLS